MAPTAVTATGLLCAALTGITGVDAGIFHLGRTLSKLGTFEAEHLPAFLTNNVCHFNVTHTHHPLTL